MKKRQTFLCITLLSTTLVANVFAGGAIGASTSILDSVFNAVVSLLRGDSCPVRQCQDCRPGEIVDDNGHCRPRQD
jgi:hypothetical protein